MQSSWTGWLAFLVLAALISVSSCQAWMGERDPATASAGADG